jgi:MinD-like ATPase involved in chromosome partitioning or flagellar assembly
VEEPTRIVLGVDVEELADEVMQFLDRTGRARVVATAFDGPTLASAVANESPDAVVASPPLVRSAGRLNGSALFALSTTESVAMLRDAMDAGARGFFVWPAERDRLKEAATRLVGLRHATFTTGASVFAVLGPRGGAGATFVATHLAAAMARKSRDTILVDMDPWFGDVAGALGVPGDPAPRTLDDLVSVAPDVTVRHAQDVLWRHESGFEALLAPRKNSDADLDPVYRSAVRALTGACDLMLLHLPRSLDRHTRAGFELADRVILVTTLDVLGFRAAMRARDFIDGGAQVDVVVNRASRSEIVPADVERVFGKPALAVIPTDRRARRMQDRGKLLPPRGPAPRAIGRLAASLLGER